MPASYFNADSITVPDPFIAGKYKFTDSIYLTDSIFYQERFEQDFDSLNDNYATDGLQIFTNYNSNIRYKRNNEYKIYFPAFIVNETSNTKTLFGVSNKIDAIQEAKDSQGIWYPIESNTYGYGCGNVYYWGLNIKPGEFLVFLMPKYEGKFETKMRLRFGNTGIIVSNAYNGKINYNQFSIKRNKDLYEWIKPSPGKAFWFFNGSYPKDL